MTKPYKIFFFVIIAMITLRFAELKLNAPNYMKAYMDLGQKNAAQTNYPQAIKDFQKATQINPTSALPYYQLALIYEKLNDQENKMKNFEKVVELGSTIDRMKNIPYKRRDWEFAHACYEVGTKYKNNGNLPMAIRMFELSLNHNELFTKSACQLGLIYNDINQKDKTFKYLYTLDNTNDRESIGKLGHAMHTLHPEWWE